MQRSAPIQPKTSNILPKFCRSAVVCRRGDHRRARGHGGAPRGQGRAGAGRGPPVLAPLDPESRLGRRELSAGADEGCDGMWQTLQGPFSAGSKPHYASKHAFESSRRDLHNALLCTAFRIQNRKLGKKGPGQNNPEKVKTRGHQADSSSSQQST